MAETTVTAPYVFVYDVFLKDAVKHKSISPYLKTWARAEMPGKLYQLPTGLPILVEEDAPIAAAAAPAPVPAAPAAAPVPVSRVYGEVMSFQNLGEVLKIMDLQEGYRADAPDASRMKRVEREVTVQATGEKVMAVVYIFPKEKFNQKEMYAVHAHGGDWRKFVMMPRFDGYQH